MWLNNIWWNYPEHDKNSPQEKEKAIISLLNINTSSNDYKELKKYVEIKTDNYEGVTYIYFSAASTNLSLATFTLKEDKLLLKCSKDNLDKNYIIWKITKHLQWCSSLNLDQYQNYIDNYIKKEEIHTIVNQISSRDKILFLSCKDKFFSWLKFDDQLFTQYYNLKKDQLQIPENNRPPLSCDDIIIEIINIKLVNIWDSRLKTLDEVIPFLKKTLQISK